MPGHGRLAPPLLALSRKTIYRRAALAAVLALAATLRLHRLPEQGLLLFDEGFLVREARSVLAIAGGLAGGGNSGGMLAEEVKNSPVLFAKPAHNFALALMLPLEPRADRATLALSAIAGTMAVWATFLLGRALFGWNAGILSALFLATSPYHLLYSRSGLSDSLTILFWTIALWTWVRGGKYSALVSGVAGGVCVATNYRELFIPLIFLFLALRETGKGNLRAGAAKFAGWTGGFLSVLLVFEIPYRVAESVSGSSFPNGTFIGQLGTLLAFHGSQGFRFTGWPAFFRYTVEWEGWVSMAWLAFAAAIQASHWKRNDGLLNITLLVPWILFSVYWDNAARFFSILLPLVAILKGRWLMEGMQALWTRAGKVPAIILGAVVMFSIVPHVRPMIPRHAPYASAAKLLAESGRPSHFSTNPWIGNAMLGSGSSAPFPPDKRMVARAGNVRFAVTDLQALFGGFDRPEERYQTARWVAQNFTAILVEPYSPEALRQYVFEQDLEFAEALKIYKDLGEGNATLKVFDLSRPIRRK